MHAMSFKCPTQDRFDGSVNNKLGRSSRDLGRWGIAVGVGAGGLDQTGSED